MLIVESDTKHLILLYINQIKLICIIITVKLFKNILSRTIGGLIAQKTISSKQPLDGQLDRRKKNNPYVMILIGLKYLIFF